MVEQRTDSGIEVKETFVEEMFEQGARHARLIGYEVPSDEATKGAKGIVNGVFPSWNLVDFSSSRIFVGVTRDASWELEFSPSDRIRVMVIVGGRNGSISEERIHEVVVERDGEVGRDEYLTQPQIIERMKRLSSWEAKSA